jgi:nucleoside-diphosphate-sugar epimerase
LRDYLFVDDAARHVSRVLASLGEASAPTSLVKIFAAGQSVSIASILGILARISKRQPRIVCMPHPRQWQQPARLQFRSERALDVDPPLTRSLASGLHMVLQQHLTLFQQGRLPGPESPGMGQVARAATLRRPAESDARTPGSRDT